VRVRDGNADINVSGAMSPLFDKGAPELRTALAGEGLSLGNFATDQHGGHQGQRSEPPPVPSIKDPDQPSLPRHRSATVPEDIDLGGTHIHITA
jgi:hypothetical protein